MDYVHLSDSVLEKHAKEQWRYKPMDDGLRKQAVRDVNQVIVARKKGEHWAWRFTALLSAYDKTGLDGFARELSNNGWRIMASAGTAKFLNERDIRTWDIAGIVGGAILGHRVVTLSRELHAALLARHDNHDDKAELEKLNVPFINLVYVNLYPLIEEIAKPESTLDSVIEKTDIGGPTILRSAAKGRRLTVCRPSEFPVVLKLINGQYYKLIRQKYPSNIKKAQEEGFDLDMRITSGLAAIAEGEIAKYCQASSDYHRQVAGEKLFQEIG